MARRRRQGPGGTIELLDDVRVDGPDQPSPIVGRGRRWAAPALLAAVVAVAALVVSFDDGDDARRPAPTTIPAPVPTTAAEPAPALADGDRLLGDPPDGFGPARASDLTPRPGTPVDAAALWASGPDARDAWVSVMLAARPAALAELGAERRTRPSGQVAVLATGRRGTTSATGGIPGGHALVVAAGLTVDEVLAVLDAVALDPTAPEGFRTDATMLPTRVHLVGSSGGLAAGAWRPTAMVTYPAAAPASGDIAVLGGPPPSLYQTVIEQFFLVDSSPATVDGRPAFIGTDWWSGARQLVFDHRTSHVIVSSPEHAVPLSAFAQTLRPPAAAAWQAALDEPR